MYLFARIVGIFFKIAGIVIGTCLVLPSLLLIFFVPLLKGAVGSQMILPEIEPLLALTSGVPGLMFLCTGVFLGLLFFWAGHIIGRAAILWRGVDRQIDHAHEVERQNQSLFAEDDLVQRQLQERARRLRKP